MLPSLLSLHIFIKRRWRSSTRWPCSASHFCACAWKSRHQSHHRRGFGGCFSITKSDRFRPSISQRIPVSGSERLSGVVDLILQCLSHIQHFTLQSAVYEIVEVEPSNNRTGCSSGRVSFLDSTAYTTRTAYSLIRPHICMPSTRYATWYQTGMLRDGHSSHCNFPVAFYMTRPLLARWIIFEHSSSERYQSDDGQVEKWPSRWDYGSLICRVITGKW